ncbi:MAG TPA: NAD(P)-dependent oxidoreductase [Ktedonobacteraceae bacterium]|nr:NAD(P)-dependent oxidoreductase [Ktedonobacteraceae bacterium]
MNILLTGASGNIGMSALRELVRQGQQVRCFVRRPAAFARVLKRIGCAGKVEIVEGDIRRAEDVTKAVQGQDTIIHLAYMIPPQSEDHPDLARSINVDGTRLLLEAAKGLTVPPRFLFSSSLDVFGHTQHLPPPRRVTDPVEGTDHYTTHKLLCEEMVRTSGLQWAIFRFADVPPLGMRSPHPIMFKIPLATRIEVIHTYDAGLAIANGVRSQDIWGRVLLIGGGQGCQILYRDYLGRMLEMMGIGMLPERAFGTEPYSTDWLDSEESQRLLHYQRYTFDDIIAQLTRLTRFQRCLVRPVRLLARWWLLRMSPYYR